MGNHKKQQPRKKEPAEKSYPKSPQNPFAKIKRT